MADIQGELLNAKFEEQTHSSLITSDDLNRLKTAMDGVGQQFEPIRAVLEQACKIVEGATPSLDELDKLHRLFTNSELRPKIKAFEQVQKCYARLETKSLLHQIESETDLVETADDSA